MITHTHTQSTPLSYTSKTLTLPSTEKPHMPKKNNQPQQLTSYSYYSNSQPCTITIVNSYKDCSTVHKKEICTLKLCKSSRVKIQHVADNMVGFIPRIHGCKMERN